MGITFHQHSSCVEAVSGYGLHLKRYSAARWSSVADTWSRLLEAAGQNSFFLSRRWVETWLEVFGTSLEASAIVFEHEDEPIAACLLVAGRRTYGLIAVQRISVNASGEDSADSSYIEFNNIVCRPGWDEAVADRLAEYLIAGEWDELALDGFSPGPAYDALKRACARFDLEETRQPSCYVDLAALRHSGLTYEAMLTRHRRRMIRQNIRAYSEIGPLHLELARTTDDALQMLEELAALNCRRVASEGQHSTFESVKFAKFHRKLIQRCLADGSVQLVRLTAGAKTIGILYNLVSGGKVYFYQCGFDYSLNAKLSPGIVTLAQTIQFYLDRGYDDFDFLSGEANYKRMLSTGSRELVWAVFRKRSAGIRMMTAAKKAKWRLLQFLGTPH